MRRRPIVVSLAVAAAIVTGSALVAELLLRQFPQLMPIQWQIRYGEIQGSRGFTVVPDLEVGFLHMPSAGTDRYGFLNREPWPALPTIIFIGDSFLNSAGVGLDGHFTGLVAHMLFDQPVLNLGVAGAGLERQARIYTRFGRPLHPRVLVTCLYLASDFDNDAQFRAWLIDGKGEDYNEFRNAYARRASGRPEYVDPWTLLKRFEFGPLLQKSRLYVRTADLAARVTGNAKRREFYSFPDGTDTVLDRPKIEFAAAPAAASDPRIEALMFAIDRLRTVTTTDDTLLLIVLIPSKEELFGVAEAIAENNVVGRARQRMKEVGVPVLDLYPPLRAAAATQSPFFDDDIHLSQYGNHLVATEVVAWFNAHRGALSSRHRVE